jgi:hypothetical protein
MSESAVDLSSLFSAALKAMKTNRQQINQLDGYNGNHGDNMTENMRIITEALQAKRSQPPSEALEYARQMLATQGKGGTSKYYAQGLSEAAGQFQGRSQLNADDIIPLLTSILGAVPSGSGDPQQPDTETTALQQIMSLTNQPQAQARSSGNAPNIEGLLNTLLPAGTAFLQAKASGADNASAAQNAMMRALTAGTVNPLQVGKPRSAAAGLVAQTILKALAARA